MVRLKVPTISPYETGSYNFNSTMVRLKACLRRNYLGRAANFNSTMVRLKVADYLGLPAAETIFQFHYGSIKRKIRLFVLSNRRVISIPLWFD